MPACAAPCHDKRDGEHGACAFAPIQGMEMPVLCPRTPDVSPSPAKHRTGQCRGCRLSTFVRGRTLACHRLKVTGCARPSSSVQAENQRQHLQPQPEPRCPLLAFCRVPTSPWPWREQRGTGRRPGAPLPLLQPWGTHPPLREHRGLLPSLSEGESPAAMQQR